MLHDDHKTQYKTGTIFGMGSFIQKIDSKLNQAQRIVDWRPVKRVK